MKTVVVFQGGGALGAYGCGAWEALAPWLQRRGDTLIALAGASIGAFNAAVVAARWEAPDAGASALSRLWREEITTPSLPFLGLPWGNSEWAREVRSWNGFLTGLLVGNRGMYVPQYPHWNPPAGLQRLAHPLYDRSRLWGLLGEAAAGYRSTDPSRQPLLAVSATGLKDGRLRLFHSDAAEVGPRELAASTAIPLMFEPVEIDGALYWDGDMVRDSLLAPLRRQLLASGRLRPGEPAQWITVEQFPAPLAEVPQSGVEVVYRVLNLLQVDKLAPVESARAEPGEAGPPDNERWIRIARAPMPQDAVSGQMDYSPDRIAELMAQGAATARQALAIESVEVAA